MVRTANVIKSVCLVSISVALPAKSLPTARRTASIAALSVPRLSFVRLSSCPFALICTFPCLPAFLCSPSISSIMSKRPSTDNTSDRPKKAKAQPTLTGFFKSAPKSKSSLDASSTTTSASTSESTSSISPPSPYKIFCDLDGVLVDFESGIQSLFHGRSSHQLPNQGMMWGAISKTPDFYANLPWTPDGKLLWEELLKEQRQSLVPLSILTGVPRNFKSRAEKFEWCKRELGVDVNHLDMAGKKNGHEIVLGRRRKGVVNVITCWSRNKHVESGENHVLIDDRLQLGTEWEKNGGIFIHHTSTATTLAMLREKGILTTAEKM